MNPYRKKIVAKILAAASFLLFAFSTAGMLAGLEPFYTKYYSFAWWSYIVFIQSVHYLKHGTSLLFRDTGRFLVLVPLSVTVWLVFETFNFRLSNWHYINIPSDTFERWTGYFLAYSTVLPGILSTVELLESAGILQHYRSRPLTGAKSLPVPLILAGIFCIILPLAWPSFFFPLVWLAFIFMLDPLNYRMGAPSLLRDLEEGSPRNIFLQLLSGLICGILWEMWNFKAGAKWVYSVPHLGFLKIFEMPALGFLGFPPFAVACCAVTASFFLLASRIRDRYHGRRAFFFYLLGAALLTIFDLLVFAGIDRFTVLSYQSGSG